MSKSVEFKPNRAGIRELLRGEAMQGVLKEYAAAVERRVGDGYEVTTFVGKGRANASVHAVSREALREVYKDNVLLKALHS